MCFCVFILLLTDCFLARDPEPESSSIQFNLIRCSGSITVKAGRKVDADDDDDDRVTNDGSGSAKAQTKWKLFSFFPSALKEESGMGQE